MSDRVRVYVVKPNFLFFFLSRIYLSSEVIGALHQVVGLEDQHVVDGAARVAQRPGAAAVQRHSERVPGLAASERHIPAKRIF